MKIFTPSIKVFSVYFSTCSLLPVLFFFFMGKSRAGGDFIAHLKYSFWLIVFGFGFALSLALLAKILGVHRSWHLLVCIPVFYVLGPYFTINDPMGFGIHIFFDLPFFLFLVLAGWLLMRLTETKP